MLGLLAIRPAFALVCFRAPLVSRRSQPVLASARKAGDSDRDMAALLESLNAGMNSWSDFEDTASAAPPPLTPGAGVKSKRAKSGKSKARAKKRGRTVATGPSGLSSALAALT